MLDFADKTLDQMPFAITPLVVITRLFGILFGRNDRFSALGDDVINELLGRITAIRQHILKLQVDNHVSCPDDVMTLARCQTQAQRVTQTINRDMDFGTESATTAA